MQPRNEASPVGLPSNRAQSREGRLHGHSRPSKITARTELLSMDLDEFKEIPRREQLSLLRECGACDVRVRDVILHAFGAILKCGSEVIVANAEARAYLLGLFLALRGAA